MRVLCRMVPGRLFQSLLTALVPGTVVGIVLRMSECFTDDAVPIVTWYRMSLGECADTCRGVPDCSAVEYHFKPLQCRLHESANMTKPCDGAAIFHLGNETLVTLTACSRAKCSPAKHSPATTLPSHSVDFCPRLALNDISTPAGNMQSIGSRVLIYCIGGVALEAYAELPETECLSNATWSCHAQCTPLCNATELGYTDTEAPGVPAADELLILSPNGTSAISNPRPPLTMTEETGASCRHVTHEETCVYSVLPEQTHMTFPNHTSLMFADDCAYTVEETMLITDGDGDTFRVYLLQ